MGTWRTGVNLVGFYVSVGGGDLGRDGAVWGGGGVVGLLRGLVEMTVS